MDGKFLTYVIRCNTMEATMAKNKMISLRVSEEDRKLLEKDAKEEQRNIGNLLIWCWKQWRKSKRR